MSVNPLQGIQVINSVNPCSSTPSHQPIHPYHYRAFPPPADPRPSPIRHHRHPSPFSCSLASSRRSILPILPPSSRNLDSPRSAFPTQPPPLDTLLEKVENCDYKRLSYPPPPPPSSYSRLRRSFFFPRPTTSTNLNQAPQLLDPPPPLPGLKL